MDSWHVLILVDAHAFKETVFVRDPNLIQSLLHIYFDKIFVFQLFPSVTSGVRIVLYVPVYLSCLTTNKDILWTKKSV